VRQARALTGKEERCAGTAVGNEEALLTHLQAFCSSTRCQKSEDEALPSARTGAGADPPGVPAQLFHKLCSLAHHSLAWIHCVDLEGYCQRVQVLTKWIRLNRHLSGSHA